MLIFENILNKHYLNKAKTISTLEVFGPAPVIGFLIVKENEINAIKTILVAKEEGLMPERLQN